MKAFLGLGRDIDVQHCAAEHLAPSRHALMLPVSISGKLKHLRSTLGGVVAVRHFNMNAYAKSPTV
jgi:hypothetical protein